MTLADDKEKNEESQEGAPKKKSMLPILMVVVGAVLGGAGVVVMTPKPEPEEHGPPPADIRLYDHPVAMEFTINPVVERGHKQAMIHFLFTYKADSKDVQPPDGAGGGGGGHGGGHGGGAEAPAELPPVLDAIKVNWNLAYSRCLEVLSNQKASTLVDPDGKRRLKRLLIEELSATLFPDGIAAVDDILWQKYFVQ